MVIVSSDGSTLFNTYSIACISISRKPPGFRIDAATADGGVFTMACYDSEKEAQEALMLIQKGIEERARAVYLSDSAARPAGNPDRDIFIDSTELGARPVRLLEKAGFRRVRDLEGATRKDLEKIRGLGPQCLKDIVSWAAGHGIDIR